MADLTLKALLDATDAVLGDDGGKHRLDDKARKVVRERDELRDALKSIGCGPEPRAAAYARGVLEELANPG